MTLISFNIYPRRLRLGEPISALVREMPFAGFPGNMNNTSGHLLWVQSNKAYWNIRHSHQKPGGKAMGVRVGKAIKGIEFFPMRLANVGDEFFCH